MALVVPVPEDSVDGAARDGAGEEDGAALQDSQTPLTTAGQRGPDQEEPPGGSAAEAVHHLSL